MNDDNKKLEIVTGDGKDLDISPVYEHLNTGKPNCNDKPKSVVIPKVIKPEEDDNEQDDNSNKKDDEESNE